jgi:hypothetical protein
MMDLIDPELQVVRTKALGTKPVRVLGNMALRAMLWTRRALDELLSQNQIDFVHIILPDHFSALLGPRVHTKHKVPYGIDYGDPWVHASPKSKKFLSKAWVSCCLSYVCEPLVVRHVRLITGASPLYFGDVFERNPSRQGRVLTAAIPVANSERDFDAISNGYIPKVKLFDPTDGNYHIVYAGALWPQARIVLERFLQAVRELLDEERSSDRLKVTFVGTGRSSDDPNGHNVVAAIDKYGLADHVFEHPARIAYLDALWHVKAASAVLILGSTERHYTPSKVFQAVQTRNPVLALLHRESMAAALLRESNAGTVVDVPDDGLLEITEIKDALRVLMSATPMRSPVSYDVFEGHSAREGTKQLAEAMELACRS